MRWELIISEWIMRSVYHSRKSHLGAESISASMNETAVDTNGFGWDTCPAAAASEKACDRIGRGMKRAQQWFPFTELFIGRWVRSCPICVKLDQFVIKFQKSLPFSAQRQSDCVTDLGFKFVGEKLARRSFFNSNSSAVVVD